MKRGKPITTALAFVAAGLTLAALGGGGESNGAAVAASRPGHAGGLPQGSEPVDLDPADFTTTIDNPYWPMRPGSRWVYRETDTEGTNERVVVEVTDRTKMIANGIEARVVRDTATEDGVPVEITDDWYAQDKEGQHLVPRRVRHELRGRRGRRSRGFLRGRRRWRPGRDRDARETEAGSDLSPGVLQGRGGGQGCRRSRSARSRSRCPTATSTTAC